MTFRKLRHSFTIGNWPEGCFVELARANTPRPFGWIRKHQLGFGGLWVLVIIQWSAHS